MLGLITFHILPNSFWLAVNKYHYLIWNVLGISHFENNIIYFDKLIMHWRDRICDEISFCNTSSVGDTFKSCFYVLYVLQMLLMNHFIANGL